jgi:phosphoglycolate phosphatase-like HAD superfamily hydrolase
VVGAEDVREHNPAAEPVLRALEALGDDPAGAIMVGDSRVDLLAAAAAGALSGAALWGAQDPAGLMALGPTYGFDRVPDILGVLDR